jgi:hypothetical protein
MATYYVLLKSTYGQHAPYEVMQLVHTFSAASIRVFVGHPEQNGSLDSYDLPGGGEQLV